MTLFFQILGWLFAISVLLLMSAGFAMITGLWIASGRGPKACEDGTCDCAREDS